MCKKTVLQTNRRERVRVPPRFFEDGRSVLCVVELCEHGDLSTVMERQASEVGVKWDGKMVEKKTYRDFLGRNIPVSVSRLQMVEFLLVTCNL